MLTGRRAPIIAAAATVALAVLMVFFLVLPKLKQVATDRKSKLEILCAEKGLKMTDQRRVIARVLSESSDHPDVEALHKRATAVDPLVSMRGG